MALPFASIGVEFDMTLMVVSKCYNDAKASQKLQSDKEFDNFMTPFSPYNCLDS